MYNRHTDILSTKCPFGKHKDKPIGEISKDYLQWCWTNLKLYGDVRQAIAARLGYTLQPDETEEEKIDRTVQAVIERLFGDEEVQDEST